MANRLLRRRARKAHSKNYFVCFLLHRETENIGQLVIAVETFMTFLIVELNQFFAQL